MPDDLTPPRDDGPRVAAAERVASVERDRAADPRRLKGNLRDREKGSLFASIEAWHLLGGMPRDVSPLMDFWERLGLPGGTRPEVHELQRPVAVGTWNWLPNPGDLDRFRRVWICPEEYAVAALDRLRAVAVKDPFRRLYWQANISRVVHQDVDADGSPVSISVIAFGVSSTEATWAFDARGVLRRGEPDPAVVAIGGALLADSHTPHRAAEPSIDDPSFRDFLRRPARG